MKNILTIGALPTTVERRSLYRAMEILCRSYAEEVFTPIDTLDFQGTLAERYKRAFLKVGEADLIIAEMSERSDGAGMEIKDAEYKGKPVVVVARRGVKVSNLIMGCPAVREKIDYESNSKLIKKLSGVLNSFK